MFIILSYLIYLFSSIFTVFSVGRHLHKNGKPYLFAECDDLLLSESANNFLYFCYLLLNSGFALLFLRSANNVTNITRLLEFIAYSQGIIFSSLGVLHMLNILLVPYILKRYLKNKLITSKNHKS